MKKSPFCAVPLFVVIGGSRLLNRFHGFTAANSLAATCFFDFDHIAADFTFKQLTYCVGFHRMTPLMGYRCRLIFTSSAFFQQMILKLCEKLSLGNGVEPVFGQHWILYPPDASHGAWRSRQRYQKIRMRNEHFTFAYLNR